MKCRSAYQKIMRNTDPDRARRLAEALRANLRRRKAQERDVAAHPGEASDDEAATPAAPKPSALPQSRP